MRELSIENLELVGGAAWPLIRLAAQGAASGALGYGTQQLTNGQSPTIGGVAGALVGGGVSGAIPGGSLLRGLGAGVAGGAAGGLTERYFSDQDESGTNYQSGTPGAAGTGYN